MSDQPGNGMAFINPSGSGVSTGVVTPQTPRKPAGNRVRFFTPTSSQDVRILTPATGSQAPSSDFEMESDFDCVLTPEDSGSPVSSPFPVTSQETTLVQEGVEKLKAVFPAIDPSVIKEALVACKYDTNRAVHKLLDNSTRKGVLDDTQMARASATELSSETQNSSLSAPVLVPGTPEHPIQLTTPSAPLGGVMMADSDECSDYGEVLVGGCEFDWTMANSYNSKPVPRTFPGLEDPFIDSSTDARHVKTEQVDLETFLGASHESHKPTKEVKMADVDRLRRMLPRVNQDCAIRTLNEFDGDFDRAHKSLLKQRGIDCENFQDRKTVRREVNRVSNPSPDRDRGRDRRSKKNKKDVDEEASKLKPAGVWVEEYLNRDQELVKVVLGSKQEFRDVPKKLLTENSRVFQEALAALATQGPGVQTLEISDVSPEAFDLLIQWLVCKNIMPVPLFTEFDGDAITAYIDFVLLAHGFEIDGPALLAEKKLAEILISSPEALKGEHIVKTYQLPKNHRICKLIVKAAVKPFVLSQEARDSLTDDEDGDMDVVMNESNYITSLMNESDEEEVSRKIAFGRAKFPFQREFDTIDRFKVELLTRANAVMTKGVHVTSGKGRYKRTSVTFVDPLDGEFFVVRRN
ncbi:hypothetical protein PVAG01_05648 [Phlyctema vagabunda]|uniref:CUE domain-containing protein n=1 Tax=Phlyctema vagabunda TaxID=108571 RepID=A0ABR4PKN2_9HELO